MACISRELLKRAVRLFNRNNALSRDRKRLRNRLLIIWDGSGFAKESFRGVAGKRSMAPSIRLLVLGLHGVEMAVGCRGQFFEAPAVLGEARERVAE